MLTRMIGALMIALATAAIYLARLQVLSGAPHQATPLEMLLATTATVTGMAGMALLVIGPAMLRPYAWPTAGPDPTRKPAPYMAAPRQGK